MNLEKNPGFSTLIHIYKNLKLKQTKLVWATMADSRNSKEGKKISNKYGL